MAYDRFLIAPYKSGLVKDMASWLTTDNSFSKLQNLHVSRGKIQKRFGSALIGDQLLSRARIGLLSTTEDLGATSGAGDLAGTVAGTVFAVGQSFSIGTEIFTVTVLGTPGVMATTGAATVHTFDTTTGAFVINGATPTITTYFYPTGYGTTTVAGTATGIVPGLIFKVGQQFSIDTEIFTVPALGIPGAMLSTGAGAGTFNTTTGAYTITGATPASVIYFYPCEPIMGITHYEKGPVNEHATYVYDTQFIYRYSGTSFIKDTTFTATFHGDYKQFFWSANYLGPTADQIALFTTNFNYTLGVNPPATDDPIYYYDNTTWGDFSAYTKFNSASDIVSSCKIIIAWKNRLLLLNTVEKDIAPTITNSAHPNRVRYSHNGNPFSNNAWLQRRQVIGADKADGGGYIDAPIEEQIMSAAVIKDRLIVYFERSTWELAYTGNTGLPFIWKSISADVGCESTFSTVNIESEILTIDTTGVYACNGVSVGRIDKQIPDEIFSFLRSAEGTQLVNGIKDYSNNFIYWTFLDYANESTHKYPNKILAYNYDSRSWSIYDDTITTFGYFEQSGDITWSSAGPWSSDATWGSGYRQAQSRRIIAGNHKGYLFSIDNTKNYNADVLPIANLTIATGTATLTIPEHNIADGDYVELKDNNISVTKDSVLSYENIFKATWVSADSISLIDPTFAGTYEGNGTLSRVSRVELQSKDWNPYVKTGDRLYLARIDFCIKNTGNGKATVNYNVDAIKGIDFVNEGNVSNASLGTNVIDLHGDVEMNPLEVYRDILWKTIYFQALGDFVNINITLSPEQMLDKRYALANFELQGMILYTMKEGR